MMLIHFLKPILALNQNKKLLQKNSLPPPKAWQMFFEISGGNKQQKQQLSHTIVDYFPCIHNSK